MKLYILYYAGSMEYEVSDIFISKEKVIKYLNESYGFGYPLDMDIDELNDELMEGDSGKIEIVNSSITLDELLVPLRKEKLKELKS
jgi:hypothetical protein